MAESNEIEGEGRPWSMTELLLRAQSGDQAAQERAARLVYDELHGMASAMLSRERPDHTLQPTALVSEAYMRLVGQSSPWKSRSHFFGIAAQTMRRILVDHARRTSAGRRDRARVVPLDGANAVAMNDAEEVVAVHEALEELEQLDARQARIVELKFFVGLSLAEIADVLAISPATVSRDWMMARAWLHDCLAQE